MTDKNRHHPRGSALITTIWIIIVIAGTALVMSRSMRVETLASANRLSQMQADVSERGAEQFLCSIVDAEVATPGSTSLIGMEGRQIGAGYFWVLKTNPDNEQTRAYGLTDEASKIDLSTATLPILNMLPNMTPDVASSIYNWKGSAVSGDGLGATDQDYESLPDPYLAKHSVFETTEELLLIRGVDKTLLFGSDTNRDGFVDSTELGAGGPAASLNAAVSSDLGIFPFVTAYGVKATSAAATGLINLNTGTQQRIQSTLQTAGIANVQNIIRRMFPTGTGNPRGGPPRQQFSSIFQWAVDMQMTTADLSKVITKFTITGAGATGASRPAKINVNTAPKQVLMCLPNFTETDADAIIAQRQTQSTATPADISWLMDAVAHNKLTGTTGSMLTGTSTVFSGDIVAVSPDGRAFRRYRVVIDGSKSPAYVIYRRDLTSFGWPLDSDIRDAMRAGNPPPDANAPATNSNSPFGQGI
jgi:type II secretory pathway component PulK